MGRIFLLIGLISVFCSSCSKKIYPVSETVHDTVSVTQYVKERDTVLKAPGAKTSVMFDWSNLIAHQGTKDTTIVGSGSSKQAHVKVQQVGKKIIVNCDCDTMAIEAKLRDTYVSEKKAKTVVRTEVQRVKYVPGFVKFLAGVGGAVLLFLLVFFVWKVVKPKMI